MRHVRYLLPVLLAALAATGCQHQKKMSEEALMAQEAAKAADARVAALEKELQELKAGSLAAAQAQKDAQTVKEAQAAKEAAEEVAKAQALAIQRQIAEAKKRAEQKKQEAAAAAAKPAAPAEAPKVVTIEVPAGTALDVTLDKELSTASAKAGDAWEGTLASAVVVDGKQVWAAGTPVKGVVAQSTPAGRLSSGKGGLGIKLIQVGNSDVDAGVYLVSGDTRGQRNAKFIGGGAALGALIGVLSDKKNKQDHALGGAAIGAAAGTAVAAATAGTEIKIAADKPVPFSLVQPEKVVLKP